MGRVLVVGIDPGLKNTGLVLVEVKGPNLPRVVTHETIRGASSFRVMAKDVVHAVSMMPSRVAGVEDFEHRAWLKTMDGRPRRVRDAVPMARLVERLVAELEFDGFMVFEINPAESKKGWSPAERKLLPRELRNNHERDAFLVASSAATLAKTAKIGDLLGENLKRLHAQGRLQ